MNVFTKKKILIIFLSFLFLFVVVFYMYIKNSSKSFDSDEFASNIPSIYIKLNNVSKNTINSNSKEIKYKGNEFILKYDNKELNKEIITIKGRGNSTWNYAKRPYQISFDSATDLLDLGESKKYVLLADYLDETLLRNHISFFVASMLDMQYNMMGKHVNLYIDNEYQGVYYLTNKVDINKGSVDLGDDNAILVELDNIFYNEGEYIKSDIFNDYLVIKDCKNDINCDTVKNNFIKKYNSLEKSVKNKNWNEIVKLIDIDSFAKYYIVNEFSFNGDAYMTSFYMYQNGLNSKIYAGPVWDFDLAYENSYDNKFIDDNLNVKSSHKKNDMKTDRIRSIMKELLEMKEFIYVVEDNWNKYMEDNLDKIIQEIDEKYDLLYDEGKKNIDRWKYKANYSDLINGFKEYIEKAYKMTRGRIIYLKEKI